ncbi:MAG: hypothetical protein J6X66_09840, partial [Lachnospiraceae bacterium]|nr:hypothetical protein [Lachnospiraceae bacterium]
MKKQIRYFLFSVVAAGVAASLLTACTGSDEGKSRGLYQGSSEPDKPDKPDKPGISYYDDIPEDELFLLIRNTNGAWYKEDNGYAIYTNGDVYGYCFDLESRNHYDGESVDLEDALEYIRDNSEPSCNLGMDFVKEAYTYGVAIDPDAGFKSENMACDMGQSTLYFVNGDERVMVYSSGDNREDPEDKNARKLQELWYDTNVPNRDQVRFYSGYDTSMVNIHCGYMDGLDGRFYLKNEEELRKFAALAGLSVAKVVENMEDYEKEYYSYFVEIQNVSSGGYDLKACAIMKNGGSYSFVMSKDSRVPDPDDTAAGMMDGFCFAAAYPWYVEAGEAEADGWISYDDAVDMFGWNEDGIITGTMYVNPDLVMAYDGGGEVFPLDYE